MLDGNDNDNDTSTIYMTQQVVKQINKTIIPDHHQYVELQEVK